MYHKVIRCMLILAVAAAGVLSAAAGAPAGAGTLPPPTRLAHARMHAAESAAIFQDVVINPASTTAYLTVPSQNEVAVLDLATGTFGPSIPVGSDPQGIDITPDGRTLYVADAGGQTISKVDIATGAVTTIATPASFMSDTPDSIVVLNNGTALYSTTFAGSGFGGHIYQLDLGTDASTVVPTMGSGGLSTEFTPLSRSADYSTAGALLGDDSAGPFDVYTAATGNVVSGTLNAFISSSALNGNGTTMLVDGKSVIAADTGTLLGTISDSCVGAVLDASGLTGFCLGVNSIVELDISRFLTGPEIPLPAGITGTGELALSPNGRVLVGVTSGGAIIVDL